MFLVNQEIQHSNTTTNLNEIFCKDSNENSFFGYLNCIFHTQVHQLLPLEPFWMDNIYACTRMQNI